MILIALGTLLICILLYYRTRNRPVPPCTHRWLERDCKQYRDMWPKYRTCYECGARQIQRGANHPWREHTL